MLGSSELSKISLISEPKAHAETTQNKKSNFPEEELQSGLPSYDEAVEQISNQREILPVKKKIIPVQSDFDSSPSPENPSSPVNPPQSPPVYPSNRFRMSQSSINLARQGGGEVVMRVTTHNNTNYCILLAGEEEEVPGPEAEEQLQ